VAKRACKFTRQGHQPCRAPPLTDREYCRFHSPDHAKEVAEARRLGGLRRRRERTVSLAYDFDGIGTIEQLRRVVRSRTLAYLAQVGMKALEVAEFDERVRKLEDAVAARRG